MWEVIIWSLWLWLWLQNQRLSFKITYFTKYCFRVGDLRKLFLRNWSFKFPPLLSAKIVPTIRDICHRNHKLCLWRENLPCGEMSPHGKYGEKSVMWRNVEKNLSYTEISLHKKCGYKSFLSQNCFVAIYAVSLLNLFCCNLHAFCVEKLNQKLCLWRKRTNIRNGGN